MESKGPPVPPRQRNRAYSLEDGEKINKTDIKKSVSDAGTSCPTRLRLSESLGSLDYAERKQKSPKRTKPKILPKPNKNVSLSDKPPPLPPPRPNAVPLKSKILESDEEDVYEDYDEVNDALHLTDDEKANCMYINDDQKLAPLTPSDPLDNPNIGAKTKQVLQYAGDKFRCALKLVHNELIMRARRKSSKCIDKENKEKFFQLSVWDLCVGLERCNISRKFIDKCRSKRLDGAFFRDISDQALADMFGLDKIEIRKFRMLQVEDWHPKIE